MSEIDDSENREHPLVVWDRQWRERAVKWEQTANEERARADTVEHQLAESLEEAKRLREWIANEKTVAFRARVEGLITPQEYAVALDRRQP
jgi:hypothetical protein